MAPGEENPDIREQGPVEGARISQKEDMEPTTIQNMVATHVGHQESLLKTVKWLELI